MTLRPVSLPAGCPFRPVGLALGNGPSALEVLVASAASPPRTPNVRSLWRERSNRRAAPLLVVVLHDGKATVCGPAGDDPPAYPGLDPGQVERICREALAQPDRHAALRSLRDALPAVVESRLPGLRNEGFLATHELEHGPPRQHEWRAAWEDASRKARTALGRRGEDLLRTLGFKIEPCDGLTSILRAGPAGSKVALGVLLQQGESPDLESERFTNLSPVTYALTVAGRENLPYVLTAQGPTLRLYPARLNVGVGRRSRTETFLEAHTSLLRDQDAGYLWLLFSGEALAEGGSLDRLLEESRRFAGELARRLRERIYGEVVPRLAQGLADARKLKKPQARDLAETYEMALLVLFRLLFIAYGEDKDLLPYRYNGLYETRSLKHKAQELLASHPHGIVLGGEPPFDADDSLWQEVRLLWRAVDEGKSEWGVPRYNGGLFSEDPAVSRAGALLAGVTLPNTVMGLVLWHLLVIDTPEGWGPVDFRSLSVREFGTIYEGLLESELSVAEVDLTVDERGFYRPCQAGEEPVVRKNRIYLHNRSGARKATGTYFTKEFAVEHLLDHALEPALLDHLARLDGLDEADAAERFFDFRVADIAMGSGHFLVAAVDRIERAFAQYLARRPLVGVRLELARLRASAREALGSLAEQIEDRLEDARLLRRLIARRCVYGVDLNPIAVHLARLSVWIHTFVPGLPLSLLDHNLVPGNSLVGIARLSEIEEKAREDDQPLYPIDAQRLVGEATEPLQRLATIADATAAEVRRARKAMEEAREATRPAEALCDIVTACRMTGEKLPIDLEAWDELMDRIVDSLEHKAARATLAHLPAFHFPVAFPEVFLRERSGFDVILGNPPWEEATLEEHAFWARHVPGLRGLNQRDQEALKADLRDERPDLVSLYEHELAAAAALRQALTSGPFPGMGTGDPDIYKAFSWRFWNLAVPDGGWVGVLLPRSAWNAKGSAEFRMEVFQHGSPVDVTMLVNNRQWVFPEVHPQYSISLSAFRRSVPAGKSILHRGPFNSLAGYLQGATRPPAEFASEDVRSWTDSASLPLLPAEQALEVFARLRAAPRLDLNDGDSWRARPHTELHATNDKALMDLESEDRPRGYWPVFKGESFDLWQPDTGRYYAWADPKILIPVLQDKRMRAARNRKSPFAEFDAKQLRNTRTLPCYSARIAFRDVTRATDSRTVRVALLPPNIFLANKAPSFLWPRGAAADQSYLLGVLSSLPLDWYARRFVETALNFFILNPFPIPRPDEGDRRRRRIIELAGRLAAPDERFAAWAEAVGVAWGPLPDAQKQDHIHELDAVVAHLYGLEERHLVHIFETFHEGWDYTERLKATLKHYREWKEKTP
jgi:hypothetical protein